MLNKKELLEKIDKMSDEEVQKHICRALDKSGIEYEIGGTGIPLSEFFESILNDIKEHLNELKNINN